jgi:hypothetical protein
MELERFLNLLALTILKVKDGETWRHALLDRKKLIKHMEH